MKAYKCKAYTLQASRSYARQPTHITEPFRHANARIQFTWVNSVINSINLLSIHVRENAIDVRVSKLFQTWFVSTSLWTIWRFKSFSWNYNSNKIVCDNLSCMWSVYQCELMSVFARCRFQIFHSIYSNKGNKKRDLLFNF